MSDLEERYKVLRQRAAVLRSAAEEMTDPALRQRALDLAVEWDLLAAELETQVKFSPPAPFPPRSRLGF